MRDEFNCSRREEELAEGRAPATGTMKNVAESHDVHIGEGVHGFQGLAA